MGVRRNAKFMSPTEVESFVKACVLMKNDIVNPGAAVEYSKWDEYVAIHMMIQAGIAPGGIPVNFGHGGLGSYSFLSWHRYFLYQFEQDLQGYVPGEVLMLPYWDWSDPAPIMTEIFLGPNGNPANSNIIELGYFAFDKPESGSNTTSLPGWWPATLNGWRLPSMFASNLQGGLRRQTGNVGLLPTAANINTTMSQTDYSAFQFAAEANPRMHNSMHVWLGGGNTCGSSFTVGHMTCAAVSPFDPFFYLHHCNIDRLWAMWQADGHANEYPSAGGSNQHNRNDIMYPWTGGAAGYGTSSGISASIPMPDFSAIGAKRNVDTLDFRSAFGYTYDTIVTMGIALDRTGSMNGMTPDPMVVGAPDVTKWEAAKRGVSAFLQDCETVQSSRAIYVMSGIKTFRSLPANDFTQVFGAPGYGLIKNGTAFSKATFDSAAGAMTPAGGTPLADALTDVQNTIVQASFGGLPADEQRYLAMFTDGLLTSGSPLSSIVDGSMNRTAIFAMGFGTGLDVDYPTLAAMVAKGKTLTTPQVFQGENAGTIDKFYTNSLATAIGFTTVFDPVIELLAGEHTHLSFTATSAEDCFLLTAQGMDFIDKNWAFSLHAPNGQVLYGDFHSHDHSNGCHHCCSLPHITSSRSNGRLTIVLQRNNADKECWVGPWLLMISYKAKEEDIMHMHELGELLFPVAAGPIRGERYLRLLTKPENRKAPRSIHTKMLHGLDFRAVHTNNSTRDACNMVVNVSARSNIKIALGNNLKILKKGAEIKLSVTGDITKGSVKYLGGFARLVSPAFNLNRIIKEKDVLDLVHANEKTKRYSSKGDMALVLAKYEKSKNKLNFINDREVKVVMHGTSPLHIHHGDSAVKGIYHLGIIVEGLYYPDIDTKHDDDPHAHHGEGQPTNQKGNFESFARMLNFSFAVE